MKRTVASELSTRLLAMEYCCKSSNVEWFKRHRRTIDAIVKQFLPSGSGFDSGIEFLNLDGRAHDGTSLKFRAAFHHMDESGYTGWTTHCITVRATFAGFDLKISGSNKNDIKDYIADTFNIALTEEIPEAFLLAID